MSMGPAVSGRGPFGDSGASFGCPSNSGSISRVLVFEPVLLRVASGGVLSGRVSCQLEAPSAGNPPGFHQCTNGLLDKPHVAGDVAELFTGYGVGAGQVPAGESGAQFVGGHTDAGAGADAQAPHPQNRFRGSDFRDGGGVGISAGDGHAVKAAEVHQQRVAVADTELVEAGDVPVHKPNLHALGHGASAGLRDRVLDKIHAGDIPTVPGQIDRIPAGATAEVEGTTGRQRGRSLDQIGEDPVGVEGVPEGQA